ncbi:hypothetical protein N7509_014262 [Penicillium cosmopolitanum]|uniref:Pentacotripeptide-repeat region of PRORP domain-containing protein n=1 Tax=Penicillium cosmopolitanum TaxID=1131564 RepID=A0A9W9S0H2_9EURO|nr:uncharacterized protein N7509_014262 [Penicillium cosmopolitanum]KAJ5369650.1 hypothetical protein N7509_014262 [Penicillium cosmopolitanum]
MLLCAQRLARSRAHGLLAPRLSGSPGCLHRGSQTSRIANIVHASTSAPLNQNSSLEFQKLATDQSQSNNYSPSHAITVLTGDGEVQNLGEAEATNTTTDQHDPDTHNPSSASRGPRRPGAWSISKKATRKILHSQGVSSKLAHSVTRRLNAQIRLRHKPLSSRELYLATVIQGNSLYSRELGLKQWRAAYKEIYLANRYEREIQNKSVLPALRDAGKEILEKIHTDCDGSFRETWNAMHRTEKASHWQRLAIWLLQHEPERLPDFLIVTTECKEKPNFTMVYDCLRYLDNFHYDTWLKDWQSGSHNYQSLVETCLDPRDWPLVSVTQKAPRLYIRRASHDGVLSALRIVKERSIRISAETALCFMWRFTELADVERALHALEFIPQKQDDGLTIDSDEVMRHCCKLLTLDTVHDGSAGRNFNILPRLLKMGVRPDRDMMNVVLSNAFKTGDPQLGNDILQFMKSHDHTFDAYTYTTLMKDAVSRGDRAKVDSLIHDIASKDELRENPYLASKIFHSHYIFTTKYMDADADPSRVFYAMLDLYNQLHDITPLKELLIIPPHYTPREGNPRGLRLCIQLVEDMLHSSSAKQENKTPYHVKPSMRTWTILLSAFIFNRQPRAADKIKEMMAKHNVKYNDVTWNVIINGYANAQNIPQTAASIKAMEQQGFSIDPYTMKSLRYLRDPERLWVAIDELDEAAPAHAQDTQPAKIETTPEHEPKPELSSEERLEKELDEGLGKLGGKMKPKL